MGIDLIIGLLILAAIYFGFQRGLILAVFSFFAVWLGIFIAFKFTAWVAGRLGELVSVSDRWLPILSFLLILVGVLILIRLGAKALEGMLELAQLGLLNRLAGSLLYLLLVLGLSSAVFQGLQWAQVVTQNDRTDSLFLQHIQPVFIDGFQGVGRWLPGGWDAWDTLERYFQSTTAGAPGL